MLINSKIKEVGVTICDLNLEEDYSENAILYQDSSIHDLGNYGQARSSKLYTSGLCVLEVNFQILKKITDLFVVNGEYIHLSFFFNGHSQVIGLDNGSSIKLDSGLIRVQYQNDTQAEIEMLPNEQVRYISIFMSRDYFLSLIRYETWVKGVAFVEDVLAKRYFHLHKGASLINPEILNLLYQIFDQEHPGAHSVYRKTFVEMKLKEILFLFHLQHHDSKPVQYSLDPKTRAALEKAKALLIANFTNPPTIQQLSRDVSLNEQKLKQNFKLFYGSTIYAFVFQLRMEEASRMILNPTYSINQIAALLGYKSTSHFIVAFKKYFGYTPRQAAIQKARLTSK